MLMEFPLMDKTMHVSLFPLTSFFPLPHFYLLAYPIARVDWVSNQSNWFWVSVVHSYTQGSFLVHLSSFQGNETPWSLGCMVGFSISFGMLVGFQSLVISRCSENVWMFSLVYLVILVHDGYHWWWCCGC